MLQTIVFSKDRACQLDSLLRSIADNCRIPIARITVLYRVSGAAYEEAYLLLMREPTTLPISWIREVDFQADVRGIVGSLDDDGQVLFLVDDDLFLRPMCDTGVLDALSAKHLFVSLRCSRDYPRDVQPDFLKTEKYLEWKWNYHRKKWVTWNYPFSVDGHVYRGRVIKRMVSEIRFQAPNSFEGEMHRRRHRWWVKRIKLGLAPTEAVVVNNPLNKVQSEGETWHQDVSAEYLNRRFLDGYRLDNRVFYGARPTSTHFAMPLEFVKELSGPRPALRGAEGETIVPDCTTSDKQAPALNGQRGA